MEFLKWFEPRNILGAFHSTKISEFPLVELDASEGFPKFKVMCSVTRELTLVRETSLVNEIKFFSITPEIPSKRVYSKILENFFPEFLPFHSISDRKSRNFWPNGKRLLLPHET